MIDEPGAPWYDDVCFLFLAGIIGIFFVKGGKKGVSFRWCERDI